MYAVLGEKAEDTCNTQLVFFFVLIDRNKDL